MTDTFSGTVGEDVVSREVKKEGWDEVRREGREESRGQAEGATKDPDGIVSRCPSH